jgi:hypothetical protein
MAKQNPTEKLNVELAFLRDQITSIGAQIGEAINEQLEETVGIVDRVSNTINKTTAKSAVKSVTDLTKGLDSALQNQLKINQGTLKLSDITKAQQGLEIRRLTLKQNLQNLENLGLITVEERKKQEIELGEALNNETKILNQQVKEYNSINQKLGVTGKLIGGISKIPVLGNLIDAEEALGAAQLEAAKNTATSTSVMKKAFSSLGSSLKTSLMDPLTGITLVLAGAKQLYDIFKKVDTETGNFAKEMGISYNEARATRKEFEEIAANSGDVNITATKLLQTQLEINKALGVNAKISEEDLKTYTQLRDVAGVEPEILNESLKLSKLRNISFKQATTSLLGQLKVTKAQLGINFSNKEIMNEVAKTSNATKISLGGSTEALVKSVAQAKALGTNLDKLDNIASSLLNFEESISAEIEAELLTGKELNLENARRLALNNDLVGLGQELKSQGIDAVKFGKMNRLQQESIAKAMGMSREEMSDMLMEQQALQTLGKQNMDQVKEEYELARKQGKEAEFLAKLGNDELASQLKSQSVQERIAVAQEKLLSAFEKLSPILESILTPIADFAGFLTSSKPLMDGIVNGALILAGIKFANFLGLRKSLGGIGSMFGGGGTGGAIMKETGKKVYGAAAQSAMKAGTATAMSSGGIKGLGKTVAKAGTKTLGKSLLKKIPIIGALAGIGFGLSRLADGDLLGAAGEVASGLASIIPGVGTAASIGIDTALMARDVSKSSEAAPLETMAIESIPFAKGGIVNKPTQALIGEAGSEAVIPLDKFYSKLDELINIIKQGGNVYLDGTKVGTAMAKGAFKLQ